MAHDHRMRPTGTNYRPTPRLARLHARRWSGYTDIVDDDVKSSQQSIDSYRSERDAKKGKLKNVGEVLHTGAFYDQQDLRDLVRTRHLSDADFNSFEEGNYY